MPKGNTPKKNTAKESGTTPQKNNSGSIAGHNELDFFFILVMVGLLGIGVYFVFDNVYEHLNSSYVPQEAPVLRVNQEKEIVSTREDARGENVDVLGLMKDPIVKDYFFQPKTYLTLYVQLSGECTGDCLSLYNPYTTDTERNSGSLTTVWRGDLGTYQYAWKGKLLYTCSRDRVSGDLLGDGAGGAEWYIARP